MALVSGARSFGALPRAVWAVGRDEQTEQTILAPIKLNLVSQDEKKSRAFRIESSSTDPDVPVICWIDGDPKMTANELLGERGSKARDEAADWLRDMLANGPMDSRELLDHAQQAGHMDRTIKRAKKELNIVAEQRRSTDGRKIEGWSWKLPGRP